MSDLFSKPINWLNTIFLSSTLLVTLTAVPAFIWQRGLSAFDLALFACMFAATGISITLGYHRLYSHAAFKASLPVRLFTLLFGAAAFENSALCWSADHRRHHKFSDQEEDPYDISKGFFHAHIGWILFRCAPETSLDWVKDLQQDKLVMWQHRYYVWIAIVVAFVFPTALGWIHGGLIGALGALLIAGVARVVMVHHMTFCINSLCHTLGRQPYSSRCSARDSGLMAWFTFGEGYHNFHHEFQHDYRNGVKPWQFDPTKWCIWLLNRVGLTGQLRRVSDDKILLAQAAEQHRRIELRLTGRAERGRDALLHALQAAQARLKQTSSEWARQKAAYREAALKRHAIGDQALAELRRQLKEAGVRLRAAWRDWQATRRLASGF